MLKTVKNRMRIVKTCNLYLTFFTLGMAVSLTGPSLLDLQHLVRTDTQHIALIYTARSIGYLVGAIFGGILLDIVKSKQAILTACNFFVTVTIFGIPWSRNFETLIGFMVVNGLSLGAIETGANVVCLQLWGKDSDPFFQAMHFTFGVGGLVSPLIAAPFLQNLKELSPSMEYNYTYFEDPFNFTDTNSTYDNFTSNGGVAKITYPFSIVGASSVLVTVMFLVVCIVSPTEDVESQSEQVDNSNRSFRFMFFAVTLTFLIFFVGIGTEIGFAQTLTTYAVKGRLHATTTVGSYMTSAFFASFTISRLVSVFLAFKISNLVLVISDICIVAVSALVLLFLMPNEWALWLASVLFGIGIGPIYAVLVGWVGIYINVTNKISAIITVGCAAGEMVGPFLITYFLEIVPEMFAYVPAASCLIVSFLLSVLYCLFKSDSNNKSKDNKKTECYVISTSKEQECYDRSTKVVVS